MTQVRVFSPALVLLTTLMAALLFALVLPNPSARAAEHPYAAGEMSIGAKEAPVTIIEYASMTCPHCARFHAGPFKELKTKYIDTGKVRLIYREFPLDAAALQAAMLARCIGEKRFFGMVNVLYESQAKWARASDPLQGLAKIARLAGFSQARFDVCLADQKLADMILNSRLNGNKEFGVNSTPSFIINGVMATGNMTMERWDELLSELLK